MLPYTRLQSAADDSLTHGFTWPCAETCNLCSCDAIARKPPAQSLLCNVDTAALSPKPYECNLMHKCFVVPRCIWVQALSPIFVFEMHQLAAVGEFAPGGGGWGG